MLLNIIFNLCNKMTIPKIESNYISTNYFIRKCNMRANINFIYSALYS